MHGEPKLLTGQDFTNHSQKNDFMYFLKPNRR